MDANTPASLDLHLILDNSSTHKTPLIQRWLLRRPRVHLHFTPTSASWLNLVECWFALLTARQLARGDFHSTRALERAIKHYITSTNAAPTPFVWTKTADEILASVARYCQRFTDSHHWVGECRNRNDHEMAARQRTKRAISGPKLAVKPARMFHNVNARSKR